MKTEKFIENITQKYQQNPQEAEKEINSFVQKIFAKETDTTWEKGAQSMLVGSFLFMLEKGNLSLDGIKKLFMLDELNSKRHKVLYKTLKKASKQVQVYFVGMVDGAEVTFKGYVSIFKNYLDILKNM